VQKGEAAKADIESTTGRQGVVEVWQVDLMSFESVRQFSRRAEQLGRVDVLIENAGVARPDFEDAEGHESTITVNIISAFLMALLLLPKLRKTAAQFNVTARLTFVSSDAHMFVCF
jgi:retinol dehydrogenase 12